MSINKMTTFSTSAAVYRRASSVVLTTPADGTTPFIRFVEEDVITDTEGTRYSPSGSYLAEDIDVTDATTFTLYDTSGLSADSDVQFSGGLPDLPTNGTFTQRDMADIIFSYYAHLVHIRATVKDGSGGINGYYSTVSGVASVS